MKLKLYYKLFGAFLLTEIAIVILLVGAMQFYASKNFANYVSKMEMERQLSVIEALGSHYAQEQDWDQLRGNFKAWQEILSNSLFRPNQGDFPPSSITQPGRGRGMMRSMGGGMGRGAHMGIGRRLTLFDENKNPVVGNASSPENHILKAITIDGEAKGWLGLSEIQQFSNPMEIDFLKQQSRMFYLVGIGIFLLAVLISWPVSRHITAPIQQLIQGTQALAARAFSTRIQVNTTDELGILAKHFNSLAQTLENYEYMQKQWMSDLSHELGTPLSVLRGEIEAMQDGIRPMVQENLDSLHFEVMHLGKIIQDCKEVSLAETRGMSIEKKTLRPFQILQETLRTYQSRLADHGIEIAAQLDFDEKITLLGDEQRLVQLFSNLLENVIRYVDSPGMLKIWETHTNDNLTLHFEDSGPGIPEEALPHLFERFYRVDQSRSREKGGSGLGLAICQHIVEAHGGTITASNATDGGLHLEIHLPLV